MRVHDVRVCVCMCVHGSVDTATGADKQASVLVRCRACDQTYSLPFTTGTRPQVSLEILFMRRGDASARRLWESWHAAGCRFLLFMDSLGQLTDRVPVPQWKGDFFLSRYRRPELRVIQLEQDR